MSFLLDTNVLSEVRKARPAPAVRRWFAAVASDDLFLSVLVVGEIRQGVERLERRDPTQAAVYRRWLDALVRDHRARLLPITPAIADRWGRLNVDDPLPVVDGLMAATALEHGLTFVTRNTEDVARTGVSLLDPFS